MHALTRQFLRIFMVAVALSASSLSGYMGVLAAFDVHAHGHHGVHSHAHDHGVFEQVAQDHHDASQSDGDEQNSANHVCAHMHVSCCGSFAVPAAECSLKLAGVVRDPVPFADSHVPHGQIASPLFRPPRASA
jgi:hypothetical protein